DVLAAGTVPHSDRRDGAVVEHHELDLRGAAATTDHCQGQQIIMLANKRVDIGEVFVAGRRRPRIFGAARRGLRWFLLPVEQRLRGWVRFWLRLGWRGLFGWGRRHDRRGLLRRRGRGWLDLFWWRRRSLGLFGRRWRGRLLRGRCICWLATGLFDLGVTQVLGGDAARRRRF